MFFSHDSYPFPFQCSSESLCDNEKLNFAATRAIATARRKILSTTRAISALTWFCHLRMYL